LVPEIFEEMPMPGTLGRHSTRAKSLVFFRCNPQDSCKGFGKEGIKQVFFNNGVSPRPGLHQSVLELNKLIRSMTPTKEKGFLKYPFS
jgi:hypothetical protein